MTVQDIEASRAAVAAETAKINEAEAALVAEVRDLEDRANALGSCLSSIGLQLGGRDASEWKHSSYWKHRKEINPTLEHFGFVIAEHPTLRDVGVVVRRKVAA